MNTVYLFVAVLYVAASVSTVRAFGSIVRRPPTTSAQPMPDTSGTPARASTRDR